MSDKQTDAALAEIADRIVEHRTHEARLEAARTLVELHGEATAAAIDELLADFVAPSGEELADLVARKLASSVEYHERAAAAASVDRSTQAQKAVKLAAQADEALTASQVPIDTTELERARELLEAARATGADPERAVAGRSVAATPQAAGAV